MTDVSAGIAAPPAPITINADRLWSSLMELAKIGAYHDTATGLVGVNRQSLTDEDALGRRLVVSWMEEAGLQVSVDQMGNIFGRREGLNLDAAPVMSASHIDTVATAGAFDGCLGVLGSLEVIRTLNEANIATRHPIVIGAFTEEEGVRFGTDMLGSAVASGRLSLEYAYNLTDRAGLRFGDELDRIGFKGGEDVLLPALHAYVECHIEQGPVLAQDGFHIGVVTGVQAISWQKLTIHGRAAHAGTTPTGLRVDAGLAAARVVVKVREMVDSGFYGHLRGNIGYIAAEPGLPSVVPYLAEITIDLRNPSDEHMTAAEIDLAEFIVGLESEQPGLRIETKRMAKTHAVPFHERVQKAIAQSADELGHRHMAIMSGAGHDAQEIAAVAPTAMIFIPGEYDGISHNPREYSTPEACRHGIDVLANTLVRLANDA